MSMAGNAGMPTHRSIVEESPLTPFLKRLTVYSGGGPFLDGYILVIIGVALLQLDPELKLTDFWKGMIGASALVGLLVGGAVFGYVTDLMGRQLMYQVDLIAIIVLSVFQVVVTSAWQLVVLRFLLGIAVGADYPIATSLLAEFSPKRHRGLMLGFLICMWYVGAVAAAVVGYFLLSAGPSGWKWMLASPALPALVLVFGRWDTPESPRWLMSKGRVQKALDTVHLVWGPNAELSDLEESGSAKTDFWTVFRGGYLRRIIFVGAFWMMQVIPLFAIDTFGPQLLEAFHLGRGFLLILGYAVINLFFLLGCLPPLLLINSLGRRPLIIGSFVFMTLGLLVLGVFPHAPAWVIITGFLIYAFFSGGPSVLEWIYPNELFPTQVRATAVGVATSISRIGAAIGTFSVPYLLLRYGIGPTMLLCCGFTLVGLGVCVALAPETKGMTLRQCSELPANR